MYKYNLTYKIQLRSWGMEFHTDFSVKLSLLTLDVKGDFISSDVLSIMYVSYLYVAYNILLSTVPSTEITDLLLNRNFSHCLITKIMSSIADA